MSEQSIQLFDDLKKWRRDAESIWGNYQMGIDLAYSGIESFEAWYVDRSKELTDEELCKAGWNAALEQAVRVIDRNPRSDRDTWLCQTLRRMQRAPR